MLKIAESIMKKSPLHHPFNQTKEPEFTCCPAAFAVFLGADTYTGVAEEEELAGDLVKEPEFTCCPAGFLGTDIFTTVTCGFAKHEGFPGDLVKEPDYTCCPAAFLGTDIFNTVTGFGERKEIKKFVKKPVENEPSQKSKKLVKKEEEEVVGGETEESIELNRRIDKFRRRRERSKQIKKREHNKKLYDAKKLAAKHARTI